jgi:hypothetical protein
MSTSAGTLVKKRKVYTKRNTAHLTIEMEENIPTMEYVDITPSVHLITSVRSAGYNDYYAVADIIDNSLDVGVKSKNVYVTCDANTVTISDDGIGMDKATLSSALTMGASVKRSSPDNMGKFGMGLNTATTSIGNRVKVITCCKTDVHRTAVYDVDKIIAGNTHVMPVYESTDEEVLLFRKLTKNAKTGTVVHITNFTNKKKDKSSRYFITNLAEELGRIFRYYIKDGKNIYINNTPVETIDPLMLDKEWEGKIAEERQTGEFVLDGHLVRYRIAMLPDYGIAKNKMAPYPINMRNQGFYLMRNNREITSGGYLGTRAANNGYNFFRCEVFITAEMDEYLGVRYNKNDVDTKGIAEDFTNALDAAVRYEFNEIVSLCKKRSKSSEVNDVLTTETANVEKEINSKINALSTITAPQVGSKAHAEAEKQKQELGEGNANTAPSTKKRGRPAKVTEELININYESKSEYAPLYRASVSGKKVILFWNTDHPFYEHLSTLNTDTFAVIQKLVVSLARTECEFGSRSDQNYDLFENFRVLFSNDLTTMLK